MKTKKMKRTQIYLDEDMFIALEKESKKTNRSISDIIRKTISIGISRKKQAFIDSVEEISGIWRDMEINPDGYVRGIRRGKRIDNY